MPYKAKPKGWEDSLNDCIREGLNFKDTNEKLVEVLGEKAHVSGAAYQRHKQKITGGKEADKVILAIGERSKEEKAEEPQTARPAWNKTKQNAADTSKLASLLNQGIYSGVMPFCENKSLKVEDVQEINLGGGIVGMIQWGFPNVNLEHPAIILVTRLIMFYLKFKQVCKAIKNKIGGEAVVLGDSPDGIKEEYKQKL